MNQRLARALPVLILLGGIAVFVALVSTRQAPERRVVPDMGPLVEAVSAPAQSRQIVVETQGAVQPADEIDLVPQVSGVVVWISPNLEPGGYFNEGDVLLRIDPRDYELAVTRAQASVERARYQLELAEEEAVVARNEWEMVRQHRDLASDAASDLVLRLPQVRAAEAELLAAQATLDETRLRLERTQLRSPFRGRVRASDLDVGQYVIANQPVSRVYSIERAEIVVSIPDEDMAFIHLPHGSRPAGIDGSVSNPRADGIAPEPPVSAVTPARVTGQFGGRSHTWEGQVTRSGGELDARSRMLQLVVEVTDPYGGVGQKQTPLLVGMFVDVDILGQTVDDVRQLPRSAVHEGDIVWVADGQSRLRMRRAHVIHVRDESVLVRLGLTDDERVVVSQLSGATDGMKVRVQDRVAGESRS